MRLPAPEASPPPPPPLFPPFPYPRPPYVLPGTSAARPIRELGGGRAAPKHYSACIPSDWELTGCFANRLRAAQRGGDTRKREREKGGERKRNPSVCQCVSVPTNVTVFVCERVSRLCLSVQLQSKERTRVYRRLPLPLLRIPSTSPSPRYSSLSFSFFGRRLHLLLRSSSPPLEGSSKRTDTH